MEEIQQFKNTPLPIAKIFREAFKFPFGQNRQFWVWAFILCLLSFVISQAEGYFIWPLLRDLSLSIKGSIVVTTMYGGLGAVLLFTLLAIACHRSILLEETHERWVDFLVWSHRETRFFIWSFLIYLGAMFGLLNSIFIGPQNFLQAGIDSVMYYLIFMDYSFFEWLIPRGWIETIMIYAFGLGKNLIVYFPILYVLSRISLLLPATAIDEKPTFAWIWNLSTGNGWRLTFLTTIPMIVCLLVSSSLNRVDFMPHPLIWIPVILGSALFFFWIILEAALLSEVYKELRSRLQVSSLAPTFDTP